MTDLQTPLLDKIQTLEDLRQLPESQLHQLADELRNETISAVSQTGGHLGAGLGVVELTVALHYVFNTPNDRLIWDVGHQSYPHKILTGRRNRITTLRKKDGLSGFTKRSESPFDPFGAGHSSTSISAGFGMAIARDLKNMRNHVISVIGDGAMSAGMAYEALNNAGASKSDMIVILNDNDMSIAQPVGALSAYLSELITSRPYHSLRVLVKEVASRFPTEIEQAAKKAKNLAREMTGAQSLFSKLGFFHIGPIDGHDLSHLLPIFKNLRDRDINGPVLVHVVTEKGKGHPFAGSNSEKYHAVPQFNIVTGEQKKPGGNLPSYTSVFADSLTDLAAKDKRIVAITAAMPSGTGLDKMANSFPEQVFDVGIAEQHAVTFAAGMAAEGMRPFCAIYSTFLQRGYDQVIHDVCLQNLPVRFAIDRAGLVGADGATHAGIYDLAYLCCLPNMTIMCPADEAELVHMTNTAAFFDDGPIALRYPRGSGTGVAIPEQAKRLKIGEARIINHGENLAILSIGTMLETCKEVITILAKNRGVNATLVDARFAKPLDTKMINKLCTTHSSLLIVEEGAPGGFAAQVLQYIVNSGNLESQLRLRVATLPDKIIDHAERDIQLKSAGLDVLGILKLSENLISDQKNMVTIA